MENQVIVIGGYKKITLKEFSEMSNTELYVLNLDDKTIRNIEEVVEKPCDKLNYMVKTKNIIKQLLDENNTNELIKAVNESLLISFKGKTISVA